MRLWDDLFNGFLPWGVIYFIHSHFQKPCRFQQYSLPSLTLTLSFPGPTHGAFVISLSSHHLSFLSNRRLMHTHTRDVLLPIEGDFINLPPTLPRKSNFLQLSKGYSWNIYRVEIKLESWNLNNIWILCLFFFLQPYKIKTACKLVFDIVY